MQKSFTFSGRASNPAKKKASPAQLAARKKFAEMARSGAFKKAKRNPAKKGLYANIDAKRKRIAAGSGEKMRKPGTAGAPTDKNFRDAAKTAKRNPIGEKFVVGKYYETRSIGDQNIKIGATILSRTDKTVKVKGTDNLMKSSYRLSMDYDGNEIFYPWGRYSMSPMIGADDMKAKSNPVKSGKKTTRTNPSKRSSTRSAVVPNPKTKKPAKISYVCIAPIEYSGSKYGIDERTPVTLKFSPTEMKLAYKCYKLPAAIVQSKEFQEFANDHIVIYMSIAELKTMLRKFIK